MAWTSHGYQIPGTTFDKPEPTSRKRCGGPKLCTVCKIDVADLLLNLPSPEIMVGEPVDYIAKAKKIVVEFVDDNFSPHIEKPAYEVYTVWFCKTLQNWKILLSTTIEDGMYYEVTYNGDKKYTYLDAYKKFKNIEIPD